MKAALDGGAWQRALRAVYKSHPPEDVTVLRQGNIEITTTRPSFWADRSNELTWGDHLNALVVRVGTEADALRQKRRELDESCNGAELAVQAATKRRSEAQAAWEENRSPENAVALAEAHEAWAAAEQAVDQVHRIRRSRWGQRSEAVRDLLRFLDHVAFDVGDVDLQEEYRGCSC